MMTTFVPCNQMNHISNMVHSVICSSLSLFAFKTCCCSCLVQKHIRNMKVYLLLCLTPLTLSCFFGPKFFLDQHFYRVSSKTVVTFVFWISRLPRGLKIPYWTFFNSPFRVDFRNIQFLPSSVPVQSSASWTEISLKFDYYPPTPRCSLKLAIYGR